MKDHRVMNENTRYLCIAYVLLTNGFVTEKYAILNTCHIPKLSKPAKFGCFHVSTINTRKKYYL